MIAPDIDRSGGSYSGTLRTRKEDAADLASLLLLWVLESASHCPWHGELVVWLDGYGEVRLHILPKDSTGGRGSKLSECISNEAYIDAYVVLGPLARTRGRNVSA